MDKLRIRGGRRLQGEIAISGAKNAALPELCAALLTAERVQLANVPRLHDVATMLKLLRTLGVAAEQGENGTPTVTLVADDLTLARGAVRAGEDDARVDPRPRAAARALRRGARLAARRLRDRHAAGRPAHQGPAGDGRRDRRRARLHRRHAPSALQRRAHHDRHGHRHRHREPADGGDAGRRRDRARERGAGARGRPTSPRC